MKPITKKDAFEEILSIFRMMAKAGVNMSVIPFRMAELMQEFQISQFEITMLRREVLYETNYLYAYDS
jgi:hypothetical protein